jgi:lysozyme
MLKDMLKRHEGKSMRNGRHMPYQDTVGKWTIGYGRNLSDCGLTEDEAELLLDNDIKRAEQELDRQLVWWREKPADVQLVLLNMTFNMGITTMLTFIRTLDLIEHDKFMAAADNLTRSKWHGQVGQRAVELEALLRGA